MRFLFLMTSLLLSCASFRAVEMPDDPKRACALWCTEALSRPILDPDEIEKACARCDLLENVDSPTWSI